MIAAASGSIAAAGPILLFDDFGSMISFADF
jgi:hypothetical protein